MMSEGSDMRFDFFLRFVKRQFLTRFTRGGEFI